MVVSEVVVTSKPSSSSPFEFRKDTFSMTVPHYTTPTKGVFQTYNFRLRMLLQRV